MVVKIDLTEEELTQIYKSNVLVIEASSLTRAIISGSLKESGFKNVYKVSDTDEARRILNEIAVDLIITDVEEGNELEGFGLSFLTELRSQDKYDHIVFMIVSGKLSRESLTRAVGLDIDHFLSRPFAPEDLSNTVFKALKNHFYPTEYNRLWTDARNLIKEKKYAEARERLLRALNLEQKPTNACYYLGHLALIEGNIQKAKEYFKTGLDARPFNLKCMLGLEFCAKKMQEEDLIFTISKKVLFLDPLHIVSMEYVLRIATMKKDMVTLVDILIPMKYYKNCPELIVAYIRENWQFLITEVAVSEKKDELPRLYSLIKIVFESDINTLISMVELLFKIESYTLAKTELLEIRSRITDEKTLAKFNIATLYGDQDYANAAMEARRFVNKNKPDYQVFWYLIGSFIKLNNMEAAKKEYSNALEQLPVNSVKMLKAAFPGVF
jgi:DNA-binding response OmpR family regulator